MSKELEMVRTMINGANEYEKKTGDKNPSVYFSKDNLLIIEQALQRLESIDNANPSEALECLEQLVEMADKCWVSCDVYKWENTIKQALLKAQEHKALEIISKKNVDMLLIKKYDNVSDYNSAVWLSGRGKLTEEEFKTLKKEVLE